MKRFLLLSALFSVVGSAQAQDMMVMRGGFGFLYPDFNSFQDPSHLTRNKGTTFQGMYQRDDNFTPSMQNAHGSFATSNGRVGFAATASRTATDLTSSTAAVDTAGAGLAVDLLKDRVSFGMSYERQISSGATADGTVNGSLLITGSKGTESGVGLALGAGSTINGQLRNVQTATVALGYAFKHNNNIEADVKFNDWNNLNDYTMGGFLTLGAKWVYFGAGYQYASLTQLSTASGRLGFNLGKHCDFSGLVGYAFNAGVSTPTYGATLRFSF